MQEIHFYIDDSGVLHPNEEHFIYGGYVFLSKYDKDLAKRKYRKLVMELKKNLGITGELKACMLKRKHKRALYNIMKEQESFYVAVENKKVYPNIMSSTKSRYRYKDYILKRIIKSKVEYFIRNKKIDPYKKVKLFIFIDEQHTATDGYYDLKSSIEEELIYGIINRDYGTFHKAILHSELDIVIEFCDSSTNYLIQASDIFDNRIYNSLKNNEPNLREKKNNTNLYLP